MACLILLSLDWGQTKMMQTTQLVPSKYVQDTYVHGSMKMEIDRVRDDGEAILEFMVYAPIRGHHLERFKQNCPNYLNIRFLVILSTYSPNLKRRQGSSKTILYVERKKVGCR